MIQSREQFVVSGRDTGVVFCRMIKIALLGCGRIAKRHSDLLGGGHINGAKLVGVCDVIRERADAISSRFDVPAYYDLAQLLEQRDVDVVSVLTPSGLHPISCDRSSKGRETRGR